MRIAHFADLQLGFSRFDGKVNRTRLRDFFDSFDAAVTHCIEEEEVKLVLISGDAFEYATPTTEVQVEFLDQISRLYDNDIRVYIISGNHDTPKTENVTHPLALAWKLNGFHKEEQLITAVHRTPWQMPREHGFPSVLMIPWVHGTPLTEENFKDADICMVHCAVDGMAAPYVESCARVAHPDWLKQYDYVALGDWHKPLRIQETNAHYPGSLERTSFGDVGTPTGGYFFDWDEENGVTNHEYWEAPSRPMRDFHLDGAGFDKPTELIEWAVTKKLDDPNELIRLTISGVDPVTVDIRDLKRKFPFLKIRWEARPAPKSVTFGPRSIIESWKHYCKNRVLDQDVMETGEDALLIVLEEHGDT